MKKRNLVVVRGGGDIATGTIYKLVKCGFAVLVLEIENPSAIRRNVAFCEAVYEGKMQVEDMNCYRAENLNQAKEIMRTGSPALLIDLSGECIRQLREMSDGEWNYIALVDAILAKKNLGTRKDMAELTVALGPGFTAGQDVDIVIETMRGHRLGRIIREGHAMENTGVPGVIAGYGKERVIHAPAAGILRNVKKITDLTEQGELMAYIEQENGEKCEVRATIPGLIRGLIRDGYPVTEGFKIADIDPRKEEYNNCFTISDKARCIAGGVVEAIMSYYTGGNHHA